MGFVSLSEALDITTPSGRALAGMLAMFAECERDILQDRVETGIDQARKEGNPHGRPHTAAKLIPERNRLRKDGLSKRAIAKELAISQPSVIRLPRAKKRANRTLAGYAKEFTSPNASLLRWLARQTSKRGRRACADRVVRKPTANPIRPVALGQKARIRAASTDAGPPGRELQAAPAASPAKSPPTRWLYWNSCTSARCP